MKYSTEYGTVESVRTYLYIYLYKIMEINFVVCYNKTKICTVGIPTICAEEIQLLSTMLRSTSTI